MGMSLNEVFFALAAMLLVWFVLVKLLVNRLSAKHPQKYESMGRPSLFLRNTPSNTWQLLKFIIRREHRGLSDSYLSSLSDVMLVFAVLYFVAFFVLIASSAKTAV